MAAEKRAVCPACGDTGEIRADGLVAECPLHDGELVEMDPEVSEQIMARLQAYAEAHPQEQVSAEPPDWEAIAGDPGRAWHAVGLLLVVMSVLLVAAVVVVLVVLW